MGPEPSGEIHPLHIHFTEHRGHVAPHHEVPNPGLHQLVVARRLIASDDVLDSLEPRNNLADSVHILWVLEIHIGPSTAASMLLHVAIAPHGKSFSEGNPLPFANPFKIPAKRLGVHSVVGRNKECRVRSRMHGLPDELVHAGQMLF